MTVECSVADGVATHRARIAPRCATRSTCEMCDALLQAARKSSSRQQVRVVFVRGNGPVFCGGADLNERKGMSEDWIRERRMRAFAAYAALEALPMPCVALVHGAAIGSGVRDRGRVRLHRRHARRLVPHARSAARHGRRHAAPAAHPRQAPGEGPDVHRPGADRGGGEGRGVCRSRLSHDLEERKARDRRSDPQGAAARARARQAHASTAASSSIRRARCRPRSRRSRSSSRPGSGWARRELAAADARAGSRRRSNAVEALVTPSARFTYRGSPGKGESGRGRDAGARHPPRRPRRHPDGERRALAVALLRRGADRRGHRAGQHALQGRGDRLLPEAGRTARLLFYVERFLNIDFGAMVRETGFANAVEISQACPQGKFTPGRGSARRHPADPVHLGHDRVSQGRDAHARQHAAQRVGGGHARRHPRRGPLLQLPAVLPRRRLDAVGADVARVRRLPGDAADLRGRRGARDDGARALHADLRATTRCSRC